MYDSWQYPPFPRFGELTVTLGSDYWWYVSEPFEVEVREGEILTIRPGFRTDFASIPPGLRLLIRPRGQFHRPAVLHDYYYRMGGATRERADKLFRDGLEIEGVGAVTRTSMYAAVRAVGGWSWPS